MGSPYTLAREQTDVSDDVDKAPAPVVPELPEPFRLRLAEPDGADPEMLARWMALPHLVETWEQAWPAERRRIDIATQLGGTYSRPCILSYHFAAIGRPDLGRRDVGYVELYRVAKDECGRLYDADALDVGFHIATADTNLIGRGIMSTFMDRLAAGLFATEPGCRRVIGDPDHRNVPTRRALVKNGWIDVGEFDIRPDRRIALHIRPRTAADMPTIRP
ncbi:GNAT family N-acetyltransferase [Nocardia sp. CNY236]|uniref:GNAT family N-acetyltransferase n=1 Tax=Nocardia sp. CNY236 TaxID=1169152 RepID=UPI0005618CD9|nr:GNAT family N-acetyltransferase [Nocardia sp. CNY236]